MTGTEEVPSTAETQDGHPQQPIVTAGFEPLAARFDEIAASRPGWSGACTVYVDGQVAADIWGGPAYDGSQIQAVFSVTKGIGAACVALLAQQGKLDYDEPVSTYWPEFAAAGKQDVTVRTLMSHQAGLAGLAGSFTLEEFIEHDGLAARLAASAPLWEPGTRHGYHSLLMGPLFRELVTRVAGVGTKAFFDEHMRKPYELDFWVGCPGEQRHRIATPTYMEMGAPPPALEAMMAADPVRRAAMHRLFPLFDALSEPATMDADLPSVNGFASARGIARFFAALTTGVADRDPVLNAETCAKVGETQAVGPDACLPVDMAFGLGFMTSFDRIPLGGPGSFGHDGAAGALGFAAPAQGLAFGWTNDSQVSMGADPAASELGTLATELASDLRRS